MNEDEDELQPLPDAPLEDLIERFSLEDESDDGTTDRSITLWIVGTLKGFGLLALVVWAASQGNRWLAVFSTGALLGGACFCSGALLGLLFAVPRGRFGKGTGSKLENTNLVQISDWLTKALVGAGLTQLHNLGDVLSRIGGTYESEIRSRGVVVAIVIYFAVGGFFSGWMITRFFVEGMLHRLHKMTYGDGTDQSEKNSQTIAKERKANRPARSRKSKTGKEPKQ